MLQLNLCDKILCYKNACILNRHYVLGHVRQIFLNGVVGLALRSILPLLHGPWTW